jgi:hypothetical protein
LSGCQSQPIVGHDRTTGLYVNQNYTAATLSLSGFYKIGVWRKFSDPLFTDAIGAGYLRCMTDDPELPRTYGPAQVAAAIGVKLGTLQSWLARKTFEVESHGAGVERRFTFDQAVVFFVAAELTRLGVAAGTAAKLALAWASGDSNAISRRPDEYVAVRIVQPPKLTAQLRKKLETV